MPLVCRFGYDLTVVTERPLSLFLILAAVTVSALTVERRNREMIRWLCDVIRSR